MYSEGVTSKTFGITGSLVSVYKQQPRTVVQQTIHKVMKQYLCGNGQLTLPSRVLSLQLQLMIEFQEIVIRIILR